jgi:hypothetical protein
LTFTITGVAERDVPFEEGLALASPAAPAQAAIRISDKRRLLSIGREGADLASGGRGSARA